MTNQNHDKRWLIAPKISSEAGEALAGFSPIMRQLLFNRGYASDAEARAYLRAETLFDTNPMQMTGIPEAVERVRYALEHNGQIAIYGDYDVDGVSATALLVQAIETLGGKALGYIPNRFDEGYGLNMDALDQLKGEGVKLVITVDCGIRSPEEAAHAHKIGLELIISDHHQPAEGDLPDAVAVINPKQVGDRYPDKDLAGVGVAYKLAQALFMNLRPSPDGYYPKLDEMLDLVALGTVADLAPLTGENRRLVRNGLKVLSQTKRQGLFSLAAVSDLSLAKVNATSIGFVLGPRLNAAGRLESAMAALDLLLTSDVRSAGELAQQLEVQNRQRQEITRKITAEAEAMIQADNPEADLLFVVHPDFNPGVVGLAASHLVEGHYRPAVVGQVGEKETRCSCRSIPEFHITEALDECKDLLIRHGGHAAAAGFTVSNGNVVALRRRLEEIAEEKLGGRDLRKTLTADAEVKLGDMKAGLLKELEYLEPTGYGNAEAVFASREVQVMSARTVGREANHLKLVVREGQLTFDCIGFRLGHLAGEGLNSGSKADLMYTFETNEFRGQTSLQLRLKDVKASEIT